MFLLLSIFFPLLSFSLVSLGFFFGKRSLVISLLCSILTMLFSVFNLIFLFKNNFIFSYYSLGSWIVSDSIYISWGFINDSLTAIMLFVVSFISLSVHIYSIDYMAHDPHQNRFMSYLSLFTFFMLILISADNFLQMFVGWEGVGLCSFLLINFWNTRIQANKAAMKAMIINRIGDFSLMLSMFILFYYFHSLDYAVLFTLVPYFKTETIILFSTEINILTLITLLIFIGAMGKSAQIGLHSWLPDAMEGPTPVSALIHSATMVTAGVFLIIRLSPIFEYAPTTLQLITIIGALTTFFAATIGLVQNDIKRIIAYSTCSQLGYMIFSCGLSNYMVSMFHLFNHAFFKALLFLCSGAIIHALSDEQDIRQMGGLRFVLPFTYTAMLIGSLALMGFPFLAGFYSKDLILGSAFSLYTTSSLFAFILGILAAFCTSFYSMRLLYLVFLTNANGFRSVYAKITEASDFMVLAFILLIIPSIFSGFFGKQLMVGFGTSFWGTSIFILPEHYTLIEVEFIPLFIKLLPLFFTFFGIYVCFKLYEKHQFIDYMVGYLGFRNNPWMSRITSWQLVIYNFLNRKWYFDKLYTFFFSQTILKTSYLATYQTVDRGFIEFYGPYGLTTILRHFSFVVNSLQTGSFYGYIFLSLYTLTGCFIFSEFFFIFPSLSYYLYSCFFLIFGIIPLNNFKLTISLSRNLIICGLTILFYFNFFFLINDFLFIIIITFIYYFLSFSNSFF